MTVVFSSSNFFVVDTLLSGMNGLELSRKALEIAPQMPIIMSTGDYSPEITRLAMEIGISKTLAKPFHPNRMLVTIRGLMGKSAMGKKASSTG